MLEIAFEIVAIFGMIGIGFLAARRRWFPEDFSRHLSKLLLGVFYPSLLFSSILRNYTLRDLAENWTLPAGAATVILVGWCVGWLAKRFVRGVRAPTRRAFHFACAMNNYSFLPIMLVAGTALGERGVAMVAFTTIGSDTLMWTLGFRTFTGQRVRWATLAQTLLRPPLLALLSAIALLALLAPLRIGPDDLAACLPTRVALDTLYRYLGGATIPASAIVCGMALGRIPLRGLVTPLQLAVAALRLVVIPLAILALLCLTPLPADFRFVFAIIALMPGAMAGVAIAEVYGGDGRFVSAHVLISHLLCILTVPLGLALFRALTQALP